MVCYDIAKPSVGHDSSTEKEREREGEANAEPKAIYLLSAIVFGMPTNQQASGVCRAHLKGKSSSSSNKSIFLYARSQYIPLPPPPLSFLASCKPQHV